MIRCINLDWLEVYCLESGRNYPHDARFFRDDGWQVQEREYGTRVFQQMFTLTDVHGNGLIEIRREPIANAMSTKGAFLSPYACHIRLTNRACYFQDAAVFLVDFLKRYEYDLQRIRRVDLCLDFERFDSLDKPSDFVHRFFRGVYSKLNQAEVAAHGKDWWDGRAWNSVAWGSKKSAISTKLYNKTMEIREVKDKPYIRQAWALAGLVDDMITLQKKTDSGHVYSPDIWRLEFSIQSSVKNWVRIESQDSDRKQIVSLPNTLDLYTTKESMLTMFASLTNHYFHFKYFKEGVRKDKCPDKVLFKWNKQTTFYKVEHVATDKRSSSLLDSLMKKLLQYRELSVDVSANEAVDKLLAILQTKKARLQLSDPYDDNEARLLQRLIAYRLTLDHEEDVATSMRYVEAWLKMEDELWSPQKAVQ